MKQGSGEDYITRRFIICNNHKIQKNETGGACSMRGGGVGQGFGGKTRGKEATWKT